MDANQLRDGIVLFIGLVVSVGVHEFGHAFVAHKLGDPTPESEGRVTLNPIAHLDLIGTVILPIFFIFVFRSGIFFGWGKPVRITPRYFKKSISMSKGDILVSFAGPFMNILFAAFLLILIGGLFRGGVLSLNDPMLHALTMYVMLNFILAAFNLLPLPPLDGSHILFALSGRKETGVIKFLNDYGMWILVILLITGALGLILGPVQKFGFSLVKFSLGVG
ncbi:MAG: site-2 protease family protein [Deltaproteobacteria bacterium]|nr:site-2 protease family protein [Deltaproteobacteria bacterium]